jgi:hypothetical protein
MNAYASKILELGYLLKIMFIPGYTKIPLFLRRSFMTEGSLAVKRCALGQNC